MCQTTYRGIPCFGKATFWVCARLVGLHRTCDRCASRWRLADWAEGLTLEPIDFSQEA